MHNSIVAGKHGFIDIAVTDDSDGLLTACVHSAALVNVTDSDGVRQQRQSSAPIKVVLDQD
jgi:hypothetical protein